MIRRTVAAAGPAGRAGRRFRFPLHAAAEFDFADGIGNWTSCMPAETLARDVPMRLLGRTRGPTPPWPGGDRRLRSDGWDIPETGSATDWAASPARPGRIGRPAAGRRHRRRAQRRLRRLPCPRARRVVLGGAPGALLRDHPRKGRPRDAAKSAAPLRPRDSPATPTTLARCRSKSAAAARELPSGYPVCRPRPPGRRSAAGGAGDLICVTGSFYIAAQIRGKG